MNAYILTLLSASLAAAVAELLAPKGEGGRLVSHVRMVAGLFLLVALLVPLREGITLLLDAAQGDMASRVEELIPEAYQPDYEAVFGDSLAAMGEEEVEAWVMATLESRFGVPADLCLVEGVCAYEAEALAITEVRIALWGGSALTDPHPIEDYFTQQLGCPCSVTVGKP